MLSFNTYQQLITNVIKREVNLAWIKKRHKLTGGLVENMDVRIDSQDKNILIDVYMYPYGLIQDRGVQAGRIPYQRGSGAGKSLYIASLERYVEMRMGLSGKKALSVAFAIANKQKKVGMQIRTRGRGTGWLTLAADKMMPEIDNLSMRYIDSVVESTLEKIKI